MTLQNFTLGTFAQGAAGAAGSFESIASVSPNGASVSFTSIPSTYQHLQVRITGRRNSAITLGSNFIRFNADTGSNYVTHYLKGNGSTVTAAGSTGDSWISIYDVMPGTSSSANIFSGEIIDIHDYKSTTKNKTVRYIGGTDQNGSGVITLGSGLWLSTSAINRIDFDVTTYVNGSVFSLYGIKGA